MTCLGCNLIETAPVTLIDGTVVCSSCEAWRFECEARAVLAMPSREARLEHLFGVFAQGSDGNVRCIKKGIAQFRGQAAAEALQAKVLELWEARRARAA
jgi:acyl-CoA-binding protein